MNQSVDSLQQVPSYVLRAAPHNAKVDLHLNETIRKLAAKLPDSLADMARALGKVESFSEYDPAANIANAAVWSQLPQLLEAAPAVRKSFFEYASQHMPLPALARILRRMVKDPDTRLRSLATARLIASGIREVALPLSEEHLWDQSGWLYGLDSPDQVRRQGVRAQKKAGAAPLKNVAALRDLLGIKSSRQLGYFLLASDANEGPYTHFTIPKRDGGERPICAPKSQLRYVQRQILRKVLDGVAPHPAAHGFVQGRSTVTNAAPHVGAEVILKFDLTDFFPTIHYHRVIGLFGSLGYPVENGLFSSKDDSASIAPTLARLCVYTPTPHEWGRSALPQGAPTSPAISNLICRRLDARLTGLSQSNGGVYTRYADDLTFSFRSSDLSIGRFRWWVDQICHQEGFFVNQKKFRVIRKSQRQTVTGIVVNDALRIPRPERRRFRATLKNCELHGVDSQARGRASFRSYLRGFASYLNMVHPTEGAEYLRRVNQLLGPEE